MDDEVGEAAGRSQHQDSQDRTGEYVQHPVVGCTIVAREIVETWSAPSMRRPCRHGPRAVINVTAATSDQATLSLMGPAP